METPLTEFYKVLRELDLPYQTHMVLNKAGLDLANNAFKQGRDITVETYTK